MLLAGWLAGWLVSALLDGRAVPAGTPPCHTAAGDRLCLTLSHAQDAFPLTFCFTLLHTQEAVGINLANQTGREGVLSAAYADAARAYAAGGGNGFRLEPFDFHKQVRCGAVTSERGGPMWLPGGSPASPAPGGPLSLPPHPPFPCAPKQCGATNYARLGLLWEVGGCGLWCLCLWLGGCKHSQMHALPAGCPH